MGNNPTVRLWPSRRHIETPSAAAIRHLTTDHSLGLGVDFTQGRKTENPMKTLEARERPATTTLLTWVLMWSPIQLYNPVRQRLTLELSGYAITAYAIHALVSYKPDNILYVEPLLPKRDRVEDPVWFLTILNLYFTILFHNTLNRNSVPLINKYMN